MYETEVLVYPKSEGGEQQETGDCRSECVPKEWLSRKGVGLAVVAFNYPSPKTNQPQPVKIGQYRKCNTTHCTANKAKT
jgi:hypothetical protein